MPAPQDSMMKQFARLKFSSFNLRVPMNWQEPQGEAADHYSQSFTASEKSTQPDMSATPPLFTAASMNKYHTQTQTMLQKEFGSFIDEMCAAVCFAWDQWQSKATMAGLVVTGSQVMGGQFPPVPINGFILAKAPKKTPALAKFSQTIATVVGIAWATYTASIKIAPPGFPAFPSYMTNPPGPAIPVPNVPIPLIQCLQVDAGLQAAALKGQMMAMHGDPTAQYASELFEAISEAINKCFMTWKTSTTFQNLKVIGANPSPMTPGPVAGTAILPPGGLV